MEFFFFLITFLIILARFFKKGYLIKINNRVSPAIPGTIIEIEKNKKAQPKFLMQSQVGKCVLTKSQGYSHLTFHHIFQCAIFYLLF